MPKAFNLSVLVASIHVQVVFGFYRIELDIQVVVALPDLVSNKVKHDNCVES